MKRGILSLALVASLIALSLAPASPALARGPWRASEQNTGGWYFMTPEERIEHQARIRSFRSYDECHAYQIKHHKLMAARAQAQGRSLHGEHRDICAHLRATR